MRHSNIEFDIFRVSYRVTTSVTNRARNLFNLASILSWYDWFGLRRLLLTFFYWNGCALSIVSDFTCVLWNALIFWCKFLKQIFSNLESLILFFQNFASKIRLFVVEFLLYTSSLIFVDSLICSILVRRVRFLYFLGFLNMSLHQCVSCFCCDNRWFVFVLKNLENVHRRFVQFHN